MRISTQAILLSSLIVLAACTPGGTGGGGPTQDATSWYNEDGTALFSTPQPIHTTTHTTLTTVPTEGVDGPLFTPTDQQLPPTPSPSIIEITPLGGDPDSAGVAEFSVSTIVRDCYGYLWLPEPYDFYADYVSSQSPAGYCPPFRDSDGYQVAVNSDATDAVIDFAGLYRVRNGEVWGVESYKTMRVIAICYGSHSRATLWPGMTLHDWLSGGRDTSPINACKLAVYQ